jgi:hypothetical protein
MAKCTTTLCVWVTAFGKPCQIMEEEQYFIHVTDCDGNVLKWCGRTFSFIPTKCGHVEIEVPPGCYSVFGTHTPPDKIVRPPFGNRLTHVQVVRANCGDHVCVTLFSPSLWHCGTWFAYAMETQINAIERGKGDVRAANAAVKAVKDFLGTLPADEFAQKTLRVVDQGPAK